MVALTLVVLDGVNAVTAEQLRLLLSLLGAVVFCVGAVMFMIALRRDRSACSQAEEPVPPPASSVPQPPCE